MVSFKYKLILPSFNALSPKSIQSSSLLVCFLHSLYAISFGKHFTLMTMFVAFWRNLFEWGFFDVFPFSSTTSIPPLGLVIVVLGHCFNKQYLLNVPLFSLCTQKHKFIHCPSHNVMSAYEYVTIRIDSQIKCAFLNTHSTCIEIADWQTVQQWGGRQSQLGCLPWSVLFHA